MTETDSTFSALSGDEIEIGAAELSGFAPAARDATLELLLPGDLPIEQSLGAAERPVVRAMLVDLLHALQLADRTAALRRLGAMLDGLDHGDCRPAQVGETGIPAIGAQVDDFDRYFRVNRITTRQPALGLARGLLQTAHAVVAMACRAEQLPPARVEQQIVGFIVYTHLLARTFDLGELS